MYININYQTGCRNCNTSPGITTSMIIIDKDDSDWRSKTEFEVMQEVEEFRIEKDYKCMFCNSSNVEVSNIEIEGQPLFDYDSLVEKGHANNDLDIIALSITKVNNVINHEIGGRQYHRLGFFVKSINKVIEYISGLDLSFFINHSDSSFYVCISEKMTNSAPVIERIIYHGFSKIEILDDLNKILKNMYDNEFPVDPNLNFPLLGAYNSNKIIKEIFSNAGKSIKMEVSYFDEDVKVLRNIIDGNINRSPIIKKILIHGIANHDPKFGNNIKTDNNETLFFLFFDYTRTINILGCNAKKEMHVSDLKYKIDLNILRMDNYKKLFNEDRNISEKRITLPDLDKVKSIVQANWLNLLQQGINHYNNKSLSMALDYLNNAISENKDNPNLYHVRAKIKEDLEDQEGAIADYKKYLYLTGDDGYVIYNQIAINFLKLKNFEKALIGFDIAIEKKQELESNEIDESFLPYFHDCIVFRVDIERIYTNRANTKLNLNDYIGCEEDCLRAIDINDEYPNSYFILGCLFLKINSNEKAYKALKTAESKGHVRAKKLLDNYFPLDL